MTSPLVERIQTIARTARRRGGSNTAPAEPGPAPDIAIIGAGFSGHRHGHPPAAAGHRVVHGVREGRRRRRGVARQHLPRRRLRRAVAPLLVLLRAARATGPARSPSSPRSSTTSATASDTYRPRAPPAARRRDRRAPSGTTTSSRWQLTTADGQRARFDVVVFGLGQLNRPAGPTSRGSTRSGAPSSTRRAGTTTTTSPASGSPSSATAPAPCSSSRRSPSRPGSSTSSSAPPTG